VERLDDGEGPVVLTERNAKRRFIEPLEKGNEMHFDFGFPWGDFRRALSRPLTANYAIVPLSRKCPRDLALESRAVKDLGGPVFPARSLRTSMPCAGSCGHRRRTDFRTECVNSLPNQSDAAQSPSTAF
jgi:hypothetical protein